MMGWGGKGAQDKLKEEDRLLINHAETKHGQNALSSRGTLLPSSSNKPSRSDHQTLTNAAEMWPSKYSQSCGDGRTALGGQVTEGHPLQVIPQSRHDDLQVTSGWPLRLTTIWGMNLTEHLMISYSNKMNYCEMMNLQIWIWFVTIRKLPSIT